MQLVFFRQFLFRCQIVVSNIQVEDRDSAFLADPHEEVSPSPHPHSSGFSPFLPSLFSFPLLKGGKRKNKVKDEENEKDVS